MRATVPRFICLMTLSLAAAGLFSSRAFAQGPKRILIQKDMLTGRDSVVQSFGTPDVQYDTAKAALNWEKIRKGISGNELSKLLGKPSRHQFDPDNALVYWWYGSRAVALSTIKWTVSFWDK